MIKLAYLKFYTFRKNYKRMNLFFLKHTRLLIFSLSFLWVDNTAVFANQNLPIIPLPQQYEKVSSVFMLSDKTTLVFDREFKDQAFLLQKELLRFKNIGVIIANSGENAFAAKNLIELKKEANAGSSVDAYSIRMTSAQVVLSSATHSGIVHAVYAFLQLARLSPDYGNFVKMNCWNMDDSPRYKWRGLMLDESRHFFGKEKVKQILDWMALYRMNRFHWHLTDTQGWRIQIKKYPLLTSVGGIGHFLNHYAPSQWDPTGPTRFYTQEEISEIVAYASERMIKIIPEIDMPGHASAALRAYPEFSGGGTPPRYPHYTFNPGKDAVYHFLRDILKEVDALFPSQIIHLGGDEVYYGNEEWKTNADIRNLMIKEHMVDLKEVEEYFFKRMSDTLFCINNMLAAWDEVADSDLPSEKTIIFFWRHTRPEQLQKALDNKFAVVLCPRNPFYFDYQQDSLQVHGPDGKKFGFNTIERIYQFTPESLAVNYPKHANILGVQANIWTERIATAQRLDYMLFPRIAALAENTWTFEKNKNIDQFYARLKNHLLLYTLDNIYYRNPFEPNKTGEPVK